MLLAGLCLRAAGYTRGTSDHVLPEHREQGLQEAFYTFHPDETEQVNAALRPVDLLDPPYTSYGSLTAYGLGLALRLTGTRGEHTELSTMSPAERRRTYYVARGLAIAFSLGVLGLAWHLGRGLVGGGAGLAAAAVVAFAPGAIQQAHFYIVDGLFALTSLAALMAILGCCRQPSRRAFAVAGLLIGATACVRLNGGLLGLVLAAGLALTMPGGPRSRLAATARAGGLWLAAAVAVGLLLAMHPFLIARPELLTQARNVGDFGLAMKFASGDYLQPWTLVDVGVTPYVDHWFGLWPLVAGWPLTWVFLGAWVWAVCRGGWPERLLALWCLLYFLPVGLLPARAVRHLVPLLAPLAILTVAAARDGWRQLPGRHARPAAAIAAAAVALHLCLYGTAFARIYLVEDARVQAGRYVAEALPPEARVAVEGGAFSAQHVITGRGRLWLDTSRLFYSGPYMACGDRVDYLHGRLRLAQALVYTDANRAVQYQAVPELFPVAASFYEALDDRSLGFEAARRFKTYPHVAGVVFRDDGADPSFLGYDHPAVSVLTSQGADEVDRRVAQWRARLVASDHCPDGALQAAAAHLRAGDGGAAAILLDSLTSRMPHALIAYRLRAAAATLTGDDEAAQRALTKFRPETVTGRLAHVANPGLVHLVPASAALSLARLGLREIAMAELQHGAQNRPAHPRDRAAMARSYLLVVDAFRDLGDRARQLEAARLSLEVEPTTQAYNALAVIAEAHDPELTRELLQASLLLDASQGAVHLALAEIYVGTTDALLARHHLDQAAQLRPELADRVAALRAGLDASR